MGYRIIIETETEAEARTILQALGTDEALDLVEDIAFETLLVPLED